MNLRIELKEISENAKTLWSLEMNMKSLLDLVRTFQMRDVFSPCCLVKNIQSREVLINQKGFYRNKSL